MFLPYGSLSIPILHPSKVLLVNIFFNLLSDVHFHFIPIKCRSGGIYIILYILKTVHPPTFPLFLLCFLVLQDSIDLLLDAVRTSNEDLAQTWKKSEQWATIEQLCSKSSRLGHQGRGQVHVTSSASSLCPPSPTPIPPLQARLEASPPALWATAPWGAPLSQPPHRPCGPAFTAPS